MHLHIVCFQPDSKIAIHRRVIEKIGLYDLGLVAQTQDKGLESVVGIGPHDMPEDGVVPNRHHGFGTGLGFLAQARAEATTEDENWYLRRLQGRNLINLHTAHAASA